MKKYLFGLVLMLIVAGGLYYWWVSSPEVNRVTVHDGKITDIKSLAQLCTVDFYEDYPMKGHIGTKHIFARVALTGSISFDLEKLRQEERGDTLVIVLPPEIVTVRESTEPGSYEIIDTWNDEFFGSSTFTTAEENAIKSKICEQFYKKVYAKGYVKQARAEAVRNLRDMLSAMTHRPVTIIDNTPDGTI